MVLHILIIKLMLMVVTTYYSALSTLHLVHMSHELIVLKVTLMGLIILAVLQILMASCMWSLRLLLLNLSIYCHYQLRRVYASAMYVRACYVSDFSS